MKYTKKDFDYIWELKEYWKKAYLTLRRNENVG